MKSFIAILFFLSTFNAFAICTSQSNFSKSVEDAIQKVDSATGNIELLNALNTLLGVNYIRHNLTAYSNQGFKFCIGAIPLERNAYQYTRYLVLVNMYSPTTKQRQTMNLLFQNASIQAIEGNRRKPWTGLDSDHMKSVLSNIRISSTQKINQSTNLIPLILKSKFGPTTAVGKRSISLTVLPDGRILGGWLRNIGYGYGFSPSGVIIDTKKMQIHEVGSMYNDLLVESDKHLRDVQPADFTNFPLKLKELTY